MVGDGRPVADVSWYDCQAFIARINAAAKAGGLGVRFRLPFCGEWYRAEYFEEGRLDDAAILDRAWLRENSSNETHEVGQKLPNRYGFADMMGNVSEWCEDGNFKSRYVAGKNFMWDIAGLRESGRILPMALPYEKDPCLGFRVVCEEWTGPITSRSHRDGFQTKDSK